MKRHLVATLAAAAAALALTACGGGSSDQPAAGGKQTVKLALWNYATTPEFKALIDGFENANPDIHVEPVDILSDDYNEKLTTMLAGGDSTDGPVEIANSRSGSSRGMAGGCGFGGGSVTVMDCHHARAVGNCMPAPPAGLK